MEQSVSMCSRNFAFIFTILFKTYLDFVVLYLLCACDPTPLSTPSVCHFLSPFGFFKMRNKRRRKKRRREEKVYPDVSVSQQQILVRNFGFLDVIASEYYPSVCFSTN